MTRAELTEAATVLRRALAALQAAPGSSPGVQGAALRQAAGALSGAAESAIEGCAIGAPLVHCFNLAVSLGPAVDAMDAVRIAALTPAPLYTAGVIVAETITYLALAAEAQLLAALELPSRQEADAQIARLNAAFLAAEDGASDNADLPVYQSLVALHAAVVRDLTIRTAPLPRVISYAIPRAMSSIALAQLLYADPSRADELVAMNKVPHPLFMPLSGFALSA